MAVIAALVSIDTIDTIQDTYNRTYEFWEFLDSLVESNAYFAYSTKPVIVHVDVLVFVHV